jgi:hypothetical protein
MSDPHDHPSWCEGNGSIDCWECGGVGSFHNCGEDCCMCADQDEPTEDCDTCSGRGVIVCPACHDGAIPSGW